MREASENAMKVDIKARRIEALVSDDMLARRRAGQVLWQPAKPRPREISTALKIYARFANSADKGGFRRLG